MTPTVRQMLQGKPVVHAVRPGDTVYDALRLMADKNIGAVLVRSGEQIEGILSERDYARKVILLGKTSRETLVSEIMTTEVISVDPGWTADQCMAPDDRTARPPPPGGRSRTGLSGSSRLATSCGPSWTRSSSPSRRSNATSPPRLPCSSEL